MAYICGTHTLVIFKNGKTWTYPVPCRRYLGKNRCPTCVARRHDLISERVRRELDRGPLWAVEVGADLERTQQGKLSRAKVLYARFPMGGRTTFLADVPGVLLGEPVELSAGNLDGRVNRWLETPKGHRWSSTRGSGFGWYSSPLECAACGIPTVVGEKYDGDGDLLCRSCGLRWTPKLFCPQCGSPVARKHERPRGAPDCQCHQCGHWWLDTRPKDGATIYANTSPLEVGDELERCAANWEWTMGDWSSFSFTDQDAYKNAVDEFQYLYGKTDPDMPPYNEIDPNEWFN